MRACWFLVAAALALGPDASAKDANSRGTFTAIFENDLFGSGRDRHFTHGSRFSYVSGRNEVPEIVGRWARRYPLFRESGTNMRVSYTLGQSIFTPEDTADPALVIDERPYAGWLYGGVGLIADHREHDGSLWRNRLDSIEINVGIVGPASYAEDIQKGWHDLIGADRPLGWRHQLRNEPGIVLLYDRQWQTGRRFDLGKFAVDADLMPNVGLALGNVFTYATASVTVRIGWNLESDYGPPRIRPSLPGSGFFEADGGPAFYVFAGIAGRAVAQNIFLDGNTFRDSHSVEKEDLVGDFQAGAVLSYGRWRIAFTNIFRTREYERQKTPDEFGAIVVSVKL